MLDDSPPDRKTKMGGSREVSHIFGKDVLTFEPRHSLVKEQPTFSSIPHRKAVSFRTGLARRTRATWHRLTMPGCPSSAMIHPEQSLSTVPVLRHRVPASDLILGAERATAVCLSFGGGSKPAFL